jgi:hypothetical protein
VSGGVPDTSRGVSNATPDEIGDENPARPEKVGGPTFQNETHEPLGTQPNVGRLVISALGNGVEHVQSLDVLDDELGADGRVL